MKPRTTDILVVGGGMVGLAAALAMARSQLNVTVLEQAFDVPGAVGQVQELSKTGYDPRVSALTCASQTFLARLGVWPYMSAQRVSPYTDMDVWDGEGTGHIHFSSRELHEPALGHIVENRVTVAALLQRANEIENISIETGVSVVALDDACSDVSQGAAGRIVSCSSKWTR